MSSTVEEPGDMSRNEIWTRDCYHLTFLFRSNDLLSVRNPLVIQNPIISWPSFLPYRCFGRRLQGYFTVVPSVSPLPFPEVSSLPHILDAVGLTPRVMVLGQKPVQPRSVVGSKILLELAGGDYLIFRNGGHHPRSRLLPPRLNLRGA